EGRLPSGRGEPRRVLASESGAPWRGACCTRRGPLKGRFPMRNVLVLGLAAALGFTAGQVFSKDDRRGPPDEVKKALEKYASPGPEHARLKALEGNFDVRTRPTMD